MANSTAPLSPMYRSQYGTGYNEQPVHMSYDMDLSREHSKKSKDKSCCQFCPSLTKLFVWTVIVGSLLGIAISIAFIIYIEKYAIDSTAQHNKTIGHIRGNHSFSGDNIPLVINITEPTLTAIYVVDNMTAIPTTEVTKTFKTGFNSSLFTTPLTITETLFTTTSPQLSAKLSPTMTTVTTSSTVEEQTETTVTENSTVTYSSHGVTESINTSPIKVKLTQKPNTTAIKYIQTTITTTTEEEQAITTTSSSITETTPTSTTFSETTTLTSLEGRALNISNQLRTTTTTISTETGSTDQSTNNSTETITSSSLSSNEELTTLAKAILVKDTEDKAHESGTEVIKRIDSNTEPSVSTTKVVSTTTVADN